MLQAQGIAIVYVSHRLDELYRICDTVTVLRDGRWCTPADSPTSTGCAGLARMLGRDDRPRSAARA
jgi:monosaccharide-transporting ATPase